MTNDARSSGRPGTAATPGRALLLLVLLPPLLLVSLGGCAGEVRVVKTNLGRDARIFCDDGDTIELVRDQSGAIRIPVHSGTQRLRVTEGPKPPLVCDLVLHLDPEPALADEIHLVSTANIVLVKHPGAGTITREDVETLVLYPEPLSRLRDPQGGPWFLPPAGQGLVLVVDTPNAVITVGDQAYRPTPLANGPGEAPVVIALPPGRALVQVTHRGYLPYQERVTVRSRTYHLLAVRLVKERVR